MRGSGNGRRGGAPPRRGALTRGRRPGATRAENQHAVAELEGEPLCQRARDALAVEAAEGARAPDAGRAGVPSGVLAYTPAISRSVREAVRWPGRE
eukprot:7322633-Prymnesium_polylepis.1